jgi:NitT/TauT family transport system substrate-binding protein
MNATVTCAAPGASCRSLLIAGWVLAGSFLGVLLVGCGARSDEEPTHFKVSYLGLTCEGPIFTAHERGYFKDEGIDVELVKTDWDSLREGLGLGRFDATHHLIMYIMKPVESGMDLKITGGIHTGCLSLQAGVDADVHKVEDLKGKTIGVGVVGSPPWMFSCRVLAAHGLDPAKDVQWVVFPPDTMELALAKGAVDAVATAEPISTILESRQKVRKVAYQAFDLPWADEYCCAVVVNGKLCREHPLAAAKLTRALMRGAKYVNSHQAETARMAVEKKYTPATVEVNTEAILKLKYQPGVAKCRKNLDEIALDLKKAGFLKASTDPYELAERVWQPLPGVTDEWVKTIDTGKASAPPRQLDPIGYAALMEPLLKSRTRKACCTDPGICCTP